MNGANEYKKNLSFYLKNLQESVHVNFIYILM